MISGLVRAWDNLLGHGEAAVTVPPLDGTLRPNRRLDEATWRVTLEGVDCLVSVNGDLLASAGSAVHLLDGETWRILSEHEAEVACLVALPDGGLALALATGDILVKGGSFDGRRYRASTDVRCITAMAASGADLYIANGSATNPPDAWQLDLLQRGASGSVWRIDLAGGESARVAGDLAWPSGIAADGTSIVVSEAWRHRLVKIDASGTGRPQVLYADLPAYPGRIAPAWEGYWLAAFAPRTQLVEFVLRESVYRRRMIGTVPRSYWIAPTLRAGRSFYEPLQGGGVKHLGLLKPWAPTMSAGLCIQLDSAFQPRLSLQSRADGATHGVTAVAEHRGRIYAAARGDGVVVSIALEDLGDET
ncbi:hypothetical protein [Microbaculum marinum]|uniref:Strictosidine synthase n=1 Tax=Microbaculum marinum TaxID=1764581 RepID=A0AAW9RZ66_9HYPH